MNPSGFAETLEDAKSRYSAFRAVDAIPEIKPALLNARDIHDYVLKTGMLCPFDEKKLKPASYEINFLGEVHFTDEEGNHKIKKIIKDKPFILKQNSIAFVYLETHFQLPIYIAIRFNLKITCVHRGLLLGTGPLVDPGFIGRLLIPLHNLTSEDYYLFGGEGLIWVEFTKLSPDKTWDSESRESTANVEYLSFPKEKLNMSPEAYFKKASHGVPAVSSIPGAVKVAQDSALAAKEENEKIKKYGIVAIVALVISFGSFLIATFNLVSSVNKNAMDAHQMVQENQNKLKKKIDELEAEVTALSKSTPDVDAPLNHHDQRTPKQKESVSSK